VSLLRRLFGVFIYCLCIGVIIFIFSFFGHELHETSPEAETVSLSSPKLSETSPEDVGLSSSSLLNIDAAVEESIREGELPGAVVMVCRHGKTAFLKAFGNRALKPVREPMTTDTIFDIASMTKVVATTPAIMQLVDKGVLRLGDPVKRYLPKFTGGGKDDVTVSQLLTHYSGLRPGFGEGKEWVGYETTLNEIWKEKITGKPGRSFAYSDLNFIVLAEIVRVLSGKGIDVYAREHIFEPLGMTETAFRPPADQMARIAPTEMRLGPPQLPKGAKPEYKMLRGEVHDLTVWRMGGVSGQAGLFSSAGDLAIYAQTLLNHGVYGGVRLLSEAAVTVMTSPQSPLRAEDVRGYGWDINSEYSSPLGDLFSGGYGHTGFTGTSIWIHPPSDSFIIILSNRVHPYGGKNINHLRGVIANIVAASIVNPDIP